MQTHTYFYNIGSIVLYKILFIRSFIYSEINTFGLPKCRKIIFAFNIFVPIPVLEMVYLKTIQKITPMDVSVSGTIDQKTYLKKFRGDSAPLAPPGSAYACWGLELWLSLFFTQRRQKPSKSFPTLNLDFKVSYEGLAFQSCHVITSNKCVLLLTKYLLNSF